MADRDGIPGAAQVIWRDPGLGAPCEELVHARVHFFNGDGASRVLNALIDTGAELRIAKRKIAGARGLQFWIFGRGHEERVRDRFHGQF